MLNKMYEINTKSFKKHVYLLQLKQKVQFSKRAFNQNVNFLYKNHNIPSCECDVYAHFMLTPFSMLPRKHIPPKGTVVVVRWFVTSSIAVTVRDRGGQTKQVNQLCEP